MQRGLLYMLLTVAVLAPVVGFTAAQPERGSETITLDGGRQGTVPFPHHRHQMAMENDCNTCHAIFPQELGSINRLKQAGTLKPKRDVMNRLCTKCHRAMKRSKQKSGPTGCTSCHHKK